MTRRAPAAARILLPAMIAGAAAFLPAAPAEAGPPFRTDDPDMVEPGHYEFYVFSTGNRHKEDAQAVLPGFEFNYGVVDGVQVHVAAPFVHDRQTDGASAPDPYASTYAYGDTELGLKLRFVKEDKGGWRPEVGIYPMYEAPTGSKIDDTGKGHGTAFLPLWLQKEVGDFTAFGGGGYWINGGTTASRIPGPSGITCAVRNQNYWFEGLGVLYKLTDAVQVGPEIFHQSRSTDQPDGVTQTGFNVGGIYDATDHDHLMLSVGRGLENARDTNMVSYYVAYQRTW